MKKSMKASAVENEVLALIEISTKKGHAQHTRWRVAQIRPCPTLYNIFQWDSADDVFPAYGREQLEQLRPIYHAVPLRSDYSAEDAHGNRADCVGYDDNPGEIVFRGTGLGEMSVEIDQRPRGHIPIWRVRNGSMPRPSEIEFLEAAVLPGVINTIGIWRARLYENAMRNLSKQMWGWLDRAGVELEARKAEYSEAIQRLREGFQKELKNE